MSKTMQKLIFKRRDIREHFGITNYRIASFVADGILDLPVKKTGRQPFWTLRQIRRAEERLRELDAPPVVPAGSNGPRTRPLTASQIERARAARI